MVNHLRNHSRRKTANASVALLLLLTLGFASMATQAQSCSETVQAAIEAVARNCADLARDSVCNAYPPASASAFDDAAVTFDQAGQRASALDLHSVSTGALDADANHWGIAVLHLSANLPQTYAGPGLLIMLAGEAAVVNQVAPDAAMAIHAPVGTAALEDATLYRRPGVIPEAVGEVAADDLLLVDAYEDTGQWLRVVNEGAIRWIEADKVARLQALEGLPKLGLGATFAWQALSIATGADYPECAEAEPWIAIQTPPDMGVSLTLNGVDIRLDSMVTLQQVHSKALSMTAHRGKATTVFGGTVRQSESVLGILGGSGEQDLAVLDWSGAMRGSAAEYARGQRAQSALNSLARANGWDEYEVYNYYPSAIHIVQPGETLYGLTARYETSVDGIIAANGGDDGLRLLAGMNLVIPKPGSGFAWRGALSEPDDQD